MAGHLEEQNTIQFLLTGLRRAPDGGYQWRFNLSGLKKGYHALVQAPGAAAPYEGPVLFIKGGESDYIQEQHRDTILEFFPCAGIKVLPGSGHWLHAEQPRLFNGIVSRFLRAQLS